MQHREALADGVVAAEVGQRHGCADADALALGRDRVQAQAAQVDDRLGRQDAAVLLGEQVGAAAHGACGRLRQRRGGLLDPRRPGVGERPHCSASSTRRGV